MQNSLGNRRGGDRGLVAPTVRAGAPRCHHARAPFLDYGIISAYRRANGGRNEDSGPDGNDDYPQKHSCAGSLVWEVPRRTLSGWQEPGVASSAGMCVSANDGTVYHSPRPSPSPLPLASRRFCFNVFRWGSGSFRNVSLNVILNVSSYGMVSVFIWCSYGIVLS